MLCNQLIRASKLLTCALPRHIFLSSLSTNSISNAKIGIIGSGPAGFYTAQHILKNFKDVQVDIFEKLPVPFGLVRYGVAPDHPEVKNATNTFEEVAADARCNFYGNVNIGHDLKATEMKKLYDGIVFAYGADDDKRLHIPGEDANGVIAARSFVGWYNGLPAHAELSPDVSCDTAVIIGQGNVALDVARILLSPLTFLQHTDICTHALQTLTKSNIRNIHIVGRRGPLQVSFTIKELREMIRLPDTKPVFHPDDFTPIKSRISEVARPRKRLVDLMCKTALDQPPLDEQQRRDVAPKKWHLEFLKSPTEILTDNHKVCGIRFEKNKLIENEDGSVSTVSTGEYSEVACGMVLRSIGYKSVQVEEGIPFDKRLGIIPNVNGRVVESVGSNDLVKGLYCSGWVKHGPVGVIATTMNEAYATAQLIVKDLKKGSIITNDEDSIGVETLLKERGIKYVTFEDYQRIDLEEIFRGRESDKPREKITSSSEMLHVAFDDQ